MEIKIESRKRAGGLAVSFFRSAIISLLGACCPAQISWFVLAVVLNSVNAVGFTRSGAYVPENPISESLVIIDPWLIHRDPPAAITRIAFFIRVETPSLDACPQFVERSLSFTRFAMGAVLTTICPVCLEMEATTALDATIAKSGCPDADFFAAIASANTLSIMLASGCDCNRTEAYHGESGKALPREIESLGLSRQTSAPLRIPGAKAYRSHNDFLSAVALASTIGLPVLRFGDHCEDGQLAKLLTHQIQSGWHIGQSIPWGHHTCQ